MKKQFRSFEDARKFVRKQNIQSQKKWREFSKHKKPLDIPGAPDKFYKEWITWGDWLGNKNISTRHIHWRSFENAQKFVSGLNLKSVKEWKEFCKSGNRPTDIPIDAHVVYKEKWIDYGFWLGTGTVATNFRKYQSYSNAKKTIKKLHFKNQNDFRKYHQKNKPEGIPADPQKVYKKDWKSWGDFLGHGKISAIELSKKRHSFKEARKFMHKQELKNYQAWQKWSKTKRPDFIPSAPDRFYKKSGWINWNDFLNTGIMSNLTKSKNYLPLNEAKKQARFWAKKYNIQTQEEWLKAYREGKIPKNIPRNPTRFYSIKKKNAKI